MGSQISFQVSVFVSFWIYSQKWNCYNRSYGCSIFNFEEPPYQHIFLKSYSEIRAMRPFSYLFIVAFKSLFFLQCHISLKKNVIWLYHPNPPHSTPIPKPHCQSWLPQSLFTFTDDLGTWLAVLFPSLSPTVILRGQYTEHYPIPWLSQTQGFLPWISIIPSLTSFICSLLSLGLFVLSMSTFHHLTIFSFPVHLLILSSLDGYSLVGIINPFPWPLHILNQLHSGFSAPTFRPLSQLGKIMIPHVLEPL